MNLRAKLLWVIRKISRSENPSPETTLGDVLERTIEEGSSLARKTFLSEEEKKKLEGINQKLNGFIQLFFVCDAIELSDPGLVEDFNRSFPNL